MIRSRGVLQYGECLPIELRRLSCIVALVAHARQDLQANRQSRMPVAVDSAPDCQSTPGERFSLSGASLRQENLGQALEAVRQLAVIRAKNTLAHIQRPPRERL